MHFNLTSANVLLDDQFQPKISDYGLRKFLPIQNKYISSRLYHETLAYVAPELACGSLRVSEKCDVYSFGVVLLELVTGQKTLRSSSWSRRSGRRTCEDEVGTGKSLGVH